MPFCEDILSKSVCISPILYTISVSVWGLIGTFHAMNADYLVRESYTKVTYRTFDFVALSIMVLHAKNVDM